MLTKVDKLKDFGIFQNYTSNGLDDFKKKNLIYGWNYSGKTTFSKLFQNLEFKDKDKYFKGCEFEFTTEINGTTQSFNQDNIEHIPFTVKVFNSEYIKRIFTWDIPNSDIKPISFYLGDPSGNLDNQIKKLDKKKEQLENIRNNRYQKLINDFDLFNKNGGKFTIKAKEIRENYLSGQLDQNQLNKGKIKTITDKIKINLQNYVLSTSERILTKKQATEINTFDNLSENLRFPENLKIISEEVKNILEDAAPKSIPFPELDKDKDLFDWVQKGIIIHKDESECKFCTKSLPDNRINDLNSYYSIKLKEIQQAIETVTDKIKSELEKLKVVFPNKKELGNIFQEDYKNWIDSYNKTGKKYKAQLTILENDLKRKAKDYFNKINATNIEIITFKEDFDNIEKEIKEHNGWLLKFDTNKKKALNKLINHYVADFLTTTNYNSKESKKNIASAIVSTINSKLLINESDRLKLETQLKSSVKGQKELNSILEILLHRNDIKIEIRNNKFTLERSGHKATNLSEGEKSAIAFSYFLTELKALREDAPPKLPTTIIFIDDPISSLDSNHIFQVRSLLHSFFKQDDYMQLFISSHNFEFFSVMLDTKLFGRISKNTNENKRPLFYIKRKDDNSSIIKKLPKAFSSYKSEYVGLFHIIKEFNDCAAKEDFEYTLILPNAVRRFLELYTLMKYPSDSEVDTRMKYIFNPEDKPLYNTKLLHWFSHQNQFEKIQQHDDKILQLEGAIKELLEHIENNDKLHWKGLNDIN